MSPQTPHAIVIISAMITPALLILGSGSLVATALLRLGRAVDRARFLLQLPEEDAKRLGWTPEILQKWLDSHHERSIIAERSVTSFFVSVTIFVLDCLSVAIDYGSHDRLTWLPVSLTIIGMLTMLLGTYYMLWDSKLAAIQIRDEIKIRR